LLQKKSVYVMQELLMRKIIWLLVCLFTIAASWLFLSQAEAVASPQTWCWPTGGERRIACMAGDVHTSAVAHVGLRASETRAPQLAIEPYVRPELADRMHTLAPVIQAAAARHNRPALSGMSNRQFAEVIAVLMYNEHNGWLEDEVEVLRVFTPLYEDMQAQVNRSGVGSDFSVWPANLRPSVALEIVRGEVPVPPPTRVITVPLVVSGSTVHPERYAAQPALLAAISREISQDRLAIEYLAANLERGLYRAHYEEVPVTWRTLAAWHNQGIVQPTQMRADRKVQTYIWRTGAYLPLARRLIANAPTNRQRMPLEAR
jgi:hypothetical protein